MVQLSSKQITSFAQPALNLCIEYISYDPNYMDDDENETDNDYEDDQDDDDDFDDYSDDEDVSWKVRRSAAKLLGSLIVCPSLVPVDYLRSSIAPALIKRLQEREESVRLDILGLLEILVKQAALKSGVLHSREHSNMVPDFSSAIFIDKSKTKKRKAINEDVSMDAERSPRALEIYQQIISPLAAALVKMARRHSKSVPTLQSTFSLL